MQQEFDPGSFRDRAGRVFIRDGRVFRAVRRDALDGWRDVAARPFYKALESDGAIVSTHEAHDVSVEGWAGVLEHERIPVVSYPYEWPFSMMRRAALHTLELVDHALTDGVALRDATPYNIQWAGTCPRFIDVLSFEPRRPGALWDGYRQFCELFLFPLMISAYLRIPFQPWLRGSLDGISTATAARMLTPRKLHRGGVFKHVYLHSLLQKSMHEASSTAVSDAAAREVVDSKAELVRHNVRSLKKLVDGLEAGRKASHWKGYEQTHTYSTAERARKETFVRDWIERTCPSAVLDLGCNTGTFSKIAASAGAYVVAVDADHDVVDDLSSTESDRILPLLWDIADPSPSMGWRLAERSSLTQRFQPDLVLSLALIHHLVIGRNIPLDDFIAELAAMRCDLIIEFVDRHDPMVERLLSQKREAFDDYTLAAFERALGEHFNVAVREPLESGSRVLYFARARSRGA